MNKFLYYRAMFPSRSIRNHEINISEQRLCSPSRYSDKSSSSTLIYSELEDPINRRRKSIANAMLLCSFFLGLCIMAATIYHGYSTVKDLNYTPILIIDDFKTIDKNVWQHEIQVGGFGNGVFNWATDDEKNSYVKDGMLYIVPTLTKTVLNESLIENNYTLNYTNNGCTSQAKDWKQLNQDCSIKSNSTTGAIIPPVRSARLTTKNSFAIRYGKVEVTAKMPRGDWIWPAIWMMPRDSKYGEWPRSGEIDIAESQGNDIYYLGKGLGRNAVHSTLHWGITHDLDMYWKTTNTFKNYLKDLSQGFHTYGIEWTPDRITTYLDNRLLTIMGVSCEKSFWQRGRFPALYSNKSIVEDIWSSTGRKSTPFDEYFYLILNVDIGGTNGYFPDGKGDKPWSNNSPQAARQFWDKRDTWYKTWPQNDYDRGMVIKSVKMWQLEV